MSSGKKGKKSKGKVFSLQSFLSNGNENPPIGVTQVAKKVRDSDDEDALPQIFQLPTAPRSTRLFEDDLVPHKPPFLAHISNLPFDIKEDDIYEFFDVSVVSVRLPREDGDTGRIRGFGQIEFESRDDLIQAISLPDPHIKNRRVRIDIPNENDQKRNYSRSNRYESGNSGFGGSNENRESSNWRRDNDNNRDDNRRTGGYNKSNYNRGPRDGSPADNSSWRTGNRSNHDTSPQRRTNSDRYNRNQGSSEVVAERPKLNLAPRTLPLPEIITKHEEEMQDVVEAPKPQRVTAEQIFGSAKPVDTAAKEKEIEEKIEKERQTRKENGKSLTDNGNTMSEKVAEINISKDDNRNNWRHREDNEVHKSSNQKKNNDRRNERDRRANDKSLAFDKSKDRNLNKDNKLVQKKDEVKKDNKNHQIKVQQPQPTPVPANKYSGLLDEDSDE